ncbi:hypothetical protein CHUAL_010573 [Chamberlinius hualienensis]
METDLMGPTTTEVHGLEIKMIEQRTILEEKERECRELIVNSQPPDTKSSDLFCPVIWDGAYCWPYAKAGSVLEIPCPSYIVGFSNYGRASKWCTPNASWYSRDGSINDNITSTWTNYTECFSNYIHDVERIHNGTVIEEYLPIVKTISKVGYSISFITLLVAFTILAIIKRLRCPRNNLHMHLFASFMLRALMTLLKNNLFIAGIGLPSNVIFAEGKPLYFNEDEKWDCKLLIAFWQYFLMANYIWILMEGLYLHNLIFMAMFSDSSGIILYIILGWTIPVLFIIPWAIARASYENTLCWTTHNNEAIFWIIRAPITVSIVINFFFFLNITRMLFIKMRTSYNPSARKRRYKLQDFRKLARSTLVLVPLFGVHYTIFLGMSTKAGIDEVTEIVWLLCDQFFSAFQGFFVAVLYCFLNGEVQSEIRKKWQRWNLSHGQISNSRSSIATQSLTCINSKPRNSLHSITTGITSGHSCAETVYAHSSLINS